MKPALTRQIIFAAGQDAGNRSMRRAGRKQWSCKDADAASETMGRLLHIMDPERYPKLTRE